MALFYLQEERGGRPFNVLRKTWHLLGLVVPVALYVDLFGRFGPTATRGILVWGLCAFLIVLFMTDLLRFRYPAFRSVYNALFGALLKADEHGRFNASIPYMAANLGLVVFCSPVVVMLCALFLNLGDAAASLVGARFGRLRFWNGRSLAGTIAFLVTSLAFGWLFLALHTVHAPDAAGAFFLGAFGSPRWVPLLAVAVGSLFAAVAELLSITALRGLVDDNLWVPPAGLIGIGLVFAGAGSVAPLFAHVGMNF